MDLIKRLPIPISGLILALLSLGNLMQDINPNIKYLFGGIGVILIILILLKVILYPKDIKNDFKNPVIVSSSGTFSMGLMILSTYLISLMPSFAYCVWIVGISLHILLMFYFTYRFIIHDFDITTVYPTYWIVFVGITMGAITAHLHGITEIDFLFFTIGFIAMLVTLPLIIYRYIKYSEIPDMNKPLICIFTALFSILIVGYVNSAEYILQEFLIVLYSIACIFYVFALYKLIEYRNLSFYPSFSAFTFPFVISALATKEFIKIAYPNLILNSILTIETLIAVVVVFYVLFEYLRFLKIVKN